MSFRVGLEPPGQDAINTLLSFIDLEGNWGGMLTIRRQSRRITPLNNKSPVLGLDQPRLQPVQPRGAAGLQALGERQAGAVVAAAGDGEVGEDEHVCA